MLQTYSMPLSKEPQNFTLVAENIVLYSSILSCSFF